MVDDKMCLGFEKDMLMARIDPDNYEKNLEKKGCVMKCISPAGQ